MSLLQQAVDLQGRTVALRRKLHQQPELGLELPLTKQAILDDLADLGLRIVESQVTSGIVAILEGAHPGPTVILRGDMDALPLQEDADVEFASQVDGAMHACGHDTHVAMLASAARLLTTHKADIAGRVAFFFQPGEEGFHGARHVLDEGLLGRAGKDADGNQVAGAFALHISSTYESGQIHVRPGPIMASADHFLARVQGRGGHASAPHAALDPIPIAAEIVLAIQSMVTRRIDIFDPAVVTVGRITAGTTNNIIPPYAEMQGTVRTLSASTRTDVLARVQKVFEGVPYAHDTTATYDLVEGYPVTVNDLDVASEVTALATEILGVENSMQMPTPIMGAEDWSYVLGEHRGAMAFLGACPDGIEIENAAPNHSNLVRFNENAFPAGVAMYAAMALHWLPAT